jgi:hypothetical protein
MQIVIRITDTYSLSINYIHRNRVMLKRLPVNTNIKLHTGNEYMGLTVLKTVGPLSEPYLERMYLTINKALEEHPRTLAIRFDLTFPEWMGFIHTDVISKFLASLEAQIEADLKRKAKSGIRVYPCTVRYIWAREQVSSHHWHYHCVIFLNKDAYFTLGDITAEEGNTAARIHKAWASALGTDFNAVRGLIQFCDNGEYYLDRNDVWNEVELSRLFEACSYLAKVATKQFGDRTKNFSSSNR